LFIVLVLSLHSSGCASHGPLPVAAVFFFPDPRCVCSICSREQGSAVFLFTPPLSPFSRPTNFFLLSGDRAAQRRAETHSCLLLLDTGHSWRQSWQLDLLPLSLAAGLPCFPNALDSRSSFTSLSPLFSGRRPEGRGDLSFLFPFFPPSLMLVAFDLGGGPLDSIFYPASFSPFVARRAFWPATGPFPPRKARTHGSQRQENFPRLANQELSDTRVFLCLFCVDGGKLLIGGAFFYSVLAERNRSAGHPFFLPLADQRDKTFFPFFPFLLARGSRGPSRQNFLPLPSHAAGHPF